MSLRIRVSYILLLICLFSSGLRARGASEPVFQCGAASIDITPEEPIRLMGYVARKTESEGIAQRLFAKALAIRSGSHETAVLITVDNCAMPKTLRDQVAQQIERRKGIPSERIVLCSTHTHSGPCLRDSIPNMFAEELPSEQREKINHYTDALADKLQRVALDAIERAKDARLYRAQGAVKFAKNRRTEGGPVDHDLPILVVKNAEGKVEAVVASYACHCTTMGGDFNQVHGDWAGFAGEFIEERNPGAIALVAIGCGADSNPHPRGQVEHARTYGGEIAQEAQRLIDGALEEVTQTLQARSKTIELPFDPLPSRAQWQERARQPGIVGYHATRNVARLESGEQLPVSLPYYVTTWNFGDQLAMVFLPGEVVVDYSLRLKGELDGRRVWINAYANYVPCYIPSERILREGGYEAESSLWYYDQPARLSPKIENMIISTVHELVPESFANRSRTELKDTAR